MSAVAKSPVAAVGQQTSSTNNKPPSHQMSEYEELRAKNIQRNNARLRALGLISSNEESQSNAMAWRTRRTGDPQPKMDTNAFGMIAKKRKRPVERKNYRKSLRLQGKAPDGKELVDDEPPPPNHTRTLSLQQERQAIIDECRQVRLRRALEVSKEGAAKAAKENPTASYEHCLMRVRTMTHKGLLNRVKAIERAAGKHSVIKMAIFKSCLQDEGLWELADVAGKALERLKALKPAVDDE